MEKEALNAQHQHWEKTFTEKPDMFGAEPSYPARKAEEIFRREGKKKIMELGCGQGRDTIFFARNGFQIHVIDYSEVGLEAYQNKGKGTWIVAIHHYQSPRFAEPTPV